MTTHFFNALDRQLHDQYYNRRGGLTPRSKYNMRFYAVKHAHAVPREEVESMDKRPLTDKGRQDTKNLVAFMKKNGEKVERILHVDTSNRGI